jgi:hypothetical protein
VARREISRRLIDYETRKSLHITLVKSTHAAFRMALFKRGLSMQEVFNHLAALIVEEHPALVQIMDNIEAEKRDKQIKQVTVFDSESIFDLIENDLIEEEFEGDDE